MFRIEGKERMYCLPWDNVVKWKAESKEAMNQHAGLTLKHVQEGNGSKEKAKAEIGRLGNWG